MIQRNRRTGVNANPLYTNFYLSGNVNYLPTEDSQDKMLNPGVAQPLFTTAFPPDEFAARRAHVMDQIGSDAITVLQGAGEYPVYMKFRQSNNFFYLTGVEVPRAMLLLDGRTKTATLFLAPRDERLERWDGPYLVPGDEAAKLTGIARVLSRDRFGEVLLQVGRERKTVYTPLRRESLNSAAPEDTLGHMASTIDDPWDGRPSREAAFVQKLRALLPHIEVRPLDQIFDAMRVIKSPREIAIMREANRIAGRALMEMMRSTTPGIYEYELEAIGQYFYHAANGLQGYYAQVLGGKNHIFLRYHKNETELKDDDLVTVDFGPDYKYYVADVKRLWPVNGKFNPLQRELYTAFLLCWEAMEQSIKPNMKPRDVIHDAVLKMDQVQATFKFTNPKVKEAVANMVDRLRALTGNSFGHSVGMEPHDQAMGEPPFDMLKPGMVFAIEFGLNLRLPEEGAYAMMEDNYVVTDTGIENLSASIPREPDDIEKVMAERGLFKP
jgi:Xaa-Pro aminopeptidase